jgi:hypothetical protein
MVDAFHECATIDLVHINDLSTIEATSEHTFARPGVPPARNDPVSWAGSLARRKRNGDMSFPILIIIPKHEKFMNYPVIPGFHKFILYVIARTAATKLSPHLPGDCFAKCARNDI